MSFLNPQLSLEGNFAFLYMNKHMVNCGKRWPASQKKKKLVQHSHGLAQRLPSVHEKIKNLFFFFFFFQFLVIFNFACYVAMNHFCPQNDCLISPRGKSLGGTLMQVFLWWIWVWWIRCIYKTDKHYKETCNYGLFLNLLNWTNSTIQETTYYSNCLLLSWPLKSKYFQNWIGLLCNK